METQQVLVALQNTLSEHKEVRLQAEEQLRNFETVNGFSVLLLQIVASENVNLHFRQSAAILLKSMTRKYWSHNEEYREDSLSPDAPKFTINDSDKALLKTNVVEAIIHVPPKVRAQVAVMLENIVHYDFPQNWPDLIPKLMTYISSQDLKITLGALEALRRVFKKYAYLSTKKAERKELTELVNGIFPILAQLFQALSQVNNLESAEMQTLLIRMFSSAINMDLGPYFCDEKNFMTWMNLMSELVQKEIPLNIQPADEDERPNFPWWQAKKYATKIFLKLAQRYGDKKFVDEKKPRLVAFAGRFDKVYAPKLLEIFMQILSTRRQGGYIPDKIAHNAINFLSIAILRNSLYKIIQPHCEQIFKEILFPLLCINDDDLELWEDDPQEYLRKENDMYDELTSLRSAAMNVLMDLGVSRSKHHLPQIMTFIASQLTPNQNPRIKDGCFSVLGALAEKLQKTSPYADHLEDLITKFVFPELGSQYPFMRVRASWLFEQFHELEFQNVQTFKMGLQAVLHLLGDKDLPVRITAALSLRHLMQNEAAVEVLRPILPSLVEQLFKLMNEIENEELVTCLTILLENFTEELTPFAVHICTHLVASFMRLFSGESEDSIVAAFEILGTLQTLLHSVSTKPEMYPPLEAIVFPLLNHILSREPGTDEFLEEALKIVQFIIYFSHQISANMWSLFPKICGLFHSFGNDLINELLGPIDNYISRSKEVFLTGGDYLNLVCDIYKKSLEDPNMPEIVAIDACKIIEVVLLNCIGRVDHIIEPVIELAMNRIQTTRGSPLKVALMEIVACCLYYNPAFTLSILEKRGWTQATFGLWFQLIPKFSRTFDKKIAILGLASMFAVPMSQLPPIVQAGIKQITTTTITLCFDRDSQVKREEEEMKKIQQEEQDDIDEAEREADQDIPDEEIEGGENFDDLVKRAAAAREDEEEEDFDEIDDDDFPDDPYGEEEEISSAIDDVDEVIFFVNILKDLAIKHSDNYTMLISHLDVAVQNQYKELMVLATKRQQEIEEEKAKAAAEQK